VLKLLPSLIDVIRYRNSRNNILSYLYNSFQGENNNVRNTEFIFIDVGNIFYRIVYFIISLRLKKKGYPCYFLFKNKDFDVPYEKLIFEGFILSDSLIQQSRHIDTKGESPPDKYLLDYKIDVDNRSITIGEINYFNIVETSLRNKYKKYNINYKSVEVLLDIDRMVKSCRLVTGYFMMIREYQKNKDCNIKFVSKEISYIPSSIFMVLCNCYSKDDSLVFFDLARGYSGYLFKVHFRTPMLSLGNLNKKGIDSRFDISESEFDKFKLGCSKDLCEDILLSEIEILKSLHQNNQNKILSLNDYNYDFTFIMMSHLFYDTGYNDCSFAFANMIEWVLETVEFFKNNRHLKLIIKPHPHEINYFSEDSKKPNETISSLLEHIELSKNIQILDKDNLAISDLLSSIDCGLVWRSTAALELVLNNVPVIIAGTPFYKIILKEQQADSREDYFLKLKEFNKSNIIQKTKEDVALFLHYLRCYKHYDLNIANYNVEMRRMDWNEEGIKKCIKGINPHFNMMVDRLIE